MADRRGNFIPGAQSDRRRHDEAKLHSAIGCKPTKISFLRRGVLAVGRHERRRQFCLGCLEACSTVLFDGWGVIWTKVGGRSLFEAAVEATASYEWFARLIEPLAQRVVLAQPQEVACDCREHAEK